MPLLSVLIPVYNRDITALALALLQEIRKTDIEAQVEVVFVDDCSADRELAAANRRTVDSLEMAALRLIELPRNLGRAGARNRLMAEAAGRWMLFLDADVIPDRGDFLLAYLECCQRDLEVVCGGISYAGCLEPQRPYSFYVFYGRRASVAPAATRNLCPWRWIFTANVMVRSDVAAAVPFETRFQGYGYEDIEWGVRLGLLYEVIHIDNPVTHHGLLTKQELQEKMRQAAPNHVVFEELHPKEAGGLRSSRIAGRLAALPNSMLKKCADLSGKLFLSCDFSNALSLVFFQLEKVLRIALEKRRRDA
jgi:glycosyltransferase involved in cell wall biosynthesis